MQELRTTTGQRIRIAYDPSRNQLTFHEDDWCADPLKSTGAPVKSSIVRPLSGPTVVALRTRCARPRTRAA
jgi:hypothetical protein